MHSVKLWACCLAHIIVCAINSLLNKPLPTPQENVGLGVVGYASRNGFIPSQNSKRVKGSVIYFFCLVWYKQVRNGWDQQQKKKISSKKWGFFCLFLLSLNQEPQPQLCVWLRGAKGWSPLVPGQALRFLATLMFCDFNLRSWLPEPFSNT